MKRGILVFGVICFLLSGCGQQKTEEFKNQEQQNQEIQTKEQQERDQTTEETGKQEAGEQEAALQDQMDGYFEEGIEKDSLFGKTELLSYRLQMPEITLSNAAIREQVREFFDEERVDFSCEKERFYWMADDCYRGMLISGDEEDYSWGTDWYFDVDYTVATNDEQYISLVKHEETYIGGAHGSYLMTGTVWDAQTGAKLTLDDLLSGKEDEKAYLSEYLIEQLSDDAESLWEDYAQILVYSIYYDPNFYIEENKLIFIFNQYELGSYASGPRFPEIPLEKLKDLENAVQDKEQALAYAESLKKPESATHYLVELPAGEKFNADLDGDGLEEEILFPKDGIIDGWEARIIINGNKFQFPIDDNIIEEYIGLLDLDSQDGKYELAVYAYGPSDDPVTVFFRYQDGAMYEIGRAESIFDREGMVSGGNYLFGDGEIYGQKYIYMPLETRVIEATWQLLPQTDQIVEKERDYYAFSSGGSELWREERPYMLLDSVILYEDCSRDADYTTVESGSRITKFYGTDGRNWLQTEILSGDELKCGWIYVEDWCVESTRDQYTQADQVIENLFLAG